VVAQPHTSCRNTFNSTGCDNQCFGFSDVLDVLVALFADGDPTSLMTMSCGRTALSLLALFFHRDVLMVACPYLHRNGGF
jgi:hypothetical protein